MNVLMLGGPNTGKSTFLVQLYGRMESGQGRLIARGMPDDLSPISSGLRRLSSGLPLEHTRASDEQVVQRLPARAHDGEPVDFSIPEYAGETLDRLVLRHRISDRWRKQANESDQWLLFARLEQFAELPRVLNNPIGELATAKAGPDGSGQASDDVGADGQTAPAEELPSPELPLDMRLVELLQMLLHERGAGPRGAVSEPVLTVVLSCWDELGIDEGRRPEYVAEERIPLLHSYVRCTWNEDALEFIGLSSQGRVLSVGEPDEDFVSQGPGQHGYVVMPDGTADADLTGMVRVP